MPRVDRASPWRRSLTAALIIVGAGGLVVAGVQIAMIVAEPTAEPWVLIMFPLVGLVYLGTGLIAWTRRPGNRIGLIMVVCGWSFFAASSLNVAQPVFAAVGLVTATVLLACTIWLVLAFPSGRLRGRAPRTVVAGAFVVALILHAPLWLFVPTASPVVSLAVADRPDLAAAGSTVQSVAGLVVVTGAIVLLIRRILRSTASQRRLLIPLYAYAVVAVLTIPVGGTLLRLLGWDPVATVVFQVGLISGVPVVFLLAVLRGGFAPTGEMQELGAWLGGGPGEALPLLEALRRMLGDPSVELLTWSGAEHRHVDAVGAPVELPTSGRDRGSLELDLGGRRVGAILYDLTLNEDPELVRHAGRIVAIAVDNERLSADLRANQEALQQSRRRLMEAGDRERTRIAQNLHDGLQVELLLLGLQAQELSTSRQAEPERSEAARRLREGIEEAAGGLRQLVYAVMPAPLLEGGLAAAVEDLADRVPLTTTVTLPSRPVRLGATVESTAYFIIAESVANAVKHGQASALSVTVRQTNTQLVITVVDDGTGGARVGAGLGLSGLTDRVDVVGGTLIVDSPPGGGTRVHAELPCAS